MNREKCRHFLLLAVLLLLALPPRLWAQSENRAALVVRYADGHTAEFKDSGGGAYTAFEPRV